MKSPTILLLAIALAGCAATNPVAEGESVGAFGAMVGRIVVFSDRNEAIMVEAKQVGWPLLNEALVLETGANLIVETSMPATYYWDRIRYPNRVDLRGNLPNFTIEKGCLSYFGDIVIDRRGGSVVLHYENRREEALLSLKLSYPETFANNTICAEPEVES